MYDTIPPEYNDLDSELEPESFAPRAVPPVDVAAGPDDGADIAF